MSDSEERFGIGELARRSGVSVKTIRYYSDSGIVSVADRSEAGYRLYDERALAQVELVRTLRELGIELATIRRVLGNELSLSEVAARHADVLDTQIRVLKLRRAVARLVALHASDPEEMRLMHDLAHASEEERGRAIGEFLDATFADLDIEPEFEARMRSAVPELPEEPTTEQIEAWIELARLVRDKDFRARIRAMAVDHSEARERGEGTGDPVARRRAAQAVAELAGGALARGVDPRSPEAHPIVAELAGIFAAAEDRSDDAEFRARLADRVVAGTDARAERYWQLMATINGWPVPPDSVPAWEWLLAALRS